jgi:ammonia channel protein AmtB
LGTLIHQNHAAGGENGSIMVGMFVSLCLANQKPSEREFFIPTGTDLSVKLLSVMAVIIWNNSLCESLHLKLIN